MKGSYLITIGKTEYSSNRYFESYQAQPTSEYDSVYRGAAESYPCLKCKELIKNEAVLSCGCTLHRHCLASLKYNLVQPGVDNIIPCYICGQSLSLYELVAYEAYSVDPSDYKQSLCRCYKCRHTFGIYLKVELPLGATTQAKCAYCKAINVVTIESEYSYTEKILEGFLI